MSITEPRPLAITSAVVDGTAHLRLAGEFDLVGAEQFDERVEAMGEIDELHLNLAAVSFVDSMAIRSLVRAHERLRRAGGSMVLDQPSEVVLRLFQLVGLDRIFEIAGASTG